MILAQSGATIWLPEAASTTAATVDWLFDFITYFSLFFFALVVVLAAYFVIKYPRSRGPATSNVTHNTALELTWSILPSLLLLVMFWYGFKGYIDIRTPPDNAYEIKVHAQQWSWEFEYPRGATSDELHAPVDTPIKLVMDSADVIHSFYVPAFRVKMDVVPQRYNYLWFNSNRAGEYKLLCAEYCGTNHSNMRAKVVIHPPGEFEKWLETADPLIALTDEEFKQFVEEPEKFLAAHPELAGKGLMPPAALGKKIAQKKGCFQCHSTDGTVITGPSWKGIWGHEAILSDGSQVMVDENYVHESVVNPGAKVVQGFDNVMTSYQGRIKDREIDMIISYLKTLK